jgi:hypothetical protein
MSDTSIGMLTNGAKLIGESVLPGTSLIMDGNLVNGAAHVAVGALAATFVAPWAVLLVAADSLSTSISGKNLWEHVNSKKSAETEVVPA